MPRVASTASAIPITVVVIAVMVVPVVIVSAVIVAVPPASRFGLA